MRHSVSDFFCRFSPKKVEKTLNKDKAPTDNINVGEKRPKRAIGFGLPENHPNLPQGRGGYTQGGTIHAY